MLTRAAGLPLFFKMVATYFIFNCALNVSEIFSRRGGLLALLVQAQALGGALDSVQENKEVADEI